MLSWLIHTYSLIYNSFLWSQPTAFVTLFLTPSFCFEFKHIDKWKEIQNVWTYTPFMGFLKFHCLPQFDDTGNLCSAWLLFLYSEPCRASLLACFFFSLFVSTTYNFLFVLWCLQRDYFNILFNFSNSQGKNWSETT